MALILNIDTSSYNSSVALSDNDKIIAQSEADSHNHTQVLLTAIKQLLNNSGYNIKDLSAIAINIGPGSYTGLRVGLATAKGLCYSGKLSIIPVNGLTAVANYAIKNNKNSSGTYIIIQSNNKGGWYYAAYDEKLNTIHSTDNSPNIDDILSKIHHRPVFVYKITYDDKNHSSQRDDIVWLQSVTLTASHLVPLSYFIITNGYKYDLLSTRLLYINSIF